MKVLVLGATGCLGHQVYKYLCRDKTLQVLGTSREPDDNLQHLMYGRCFHLFDATKGGIEEKLRSLHSMFGPFDYIINSIGMIKPAINGNNPASIARAIRVNAEFPHKLADCFKESKCKIIHPSTDCVFSGDREMTAYYEKDTPDATDTYGRTKALGECLRVMNIRASIIGPELHTRRSLLEWFLNEEAETVNGYTNHFWNGMTTLQWARIVYNIIQMNRWKAGIQHFYSNPVTKAELLQIFKEEFTNVGVTTPAVLPIEAPEKKSMLLNTLNYGYVAGFTIPSLRTQVRELARMMHGDNNDQT